MELKRQNEQVEHELMGRLRVGGKWYGRGDKLMLDKSDAEVYEQRGISKPTGRKPEPQVEKVPASQIGLITKDAEHPAEVEPPPAKQEEAPLKNDQPVRRAEQELNNGKSRGKGR